MKTILLRFPEESVGELLDGRFKDQPKIADARGRVITSSRTKPILRLAETIDRLSFLETLLPDSLYGIHFGFVRLADSDLASLQGLKGLRLVDLSGTGLSENGFLLILSTLPFLRSVSFGGTRVTDLTLRDMAFSLSIRVFQTWGRRVNIGDRGAYSIGEKLPKLLKLDLSHTEIADEGIRSINHLALRSLNVGMNRITDLGIAHLSGMTSLRNLSLHNTAISDAALYFLQRLDKLDFLDISGTKVCAEGLEFVSKLPTLRVLLANGIKLSERAAAVLSGMSQLRILSLGVQPFSYSDLIFRLREKLSSCRVIAQVT